MARKIDPEKRQRILQAAREAFSELGVEKTTIPLIAKNAGIAAGTVYLYFKSKNEIVEGLVDLYMSRSIHRVMRKLSHEDTATAIKNAVHEALLLARKEKDLLRLIDVYRGSGNMKPTRQDEASMNLLTSFIERAIEKKEANIYNPRIAAEIVGGMIEWIAKLCFTYKIADICRYEATLVQMLQYALIKDFQPAKKANTGKSSSLPCRKNRA